MTDAGPEQSTSADILRMTAEVVAAYVRNNPIPTAELGSIISTVASKRKDSCVTTAISLRSDARPIRVSEIPSSSIEPPGR